MQTRFGFFLLTLFITALCSGCKAQESWQDMKNASPRQRAGFQTKVMTEKLGLDAGQEKKISVINLKYAEKFQPVIKSDTDRKVKLSQLLALQKQKDAELQTVFTDKQFAQYKDFEAKLKSRIMSRLSSSN